MLYSYNSVNTYYYDFFVGVIPFLSFILNSVDFIVNNTAFGGCTEILKNLDDGSSNIKQK